MQAQANLITRRQLVTSRVPVSNLANNMPPTRPTCYETILNHAIVPDLLHHKRQGQTRQGQSHSRTDLSLYISIRETPFYFRANHLNVGLIWARASKRLANINGRLLPVHGYTPFSRFSPEWHGTEPRRIKWGQLASVKICTFRQQIQKRGKGSNFKVENKTADVKRFQHSCGRSAQELHGRDRLLAKKLENENAAGNSL